jgi:hypothetical protein
VLEPVVVLVVAGLTIQPAAMVYLVKEITVEVVVALVQIMEMVVVVVQDLLVETVHI